MSDAIQRRAHALIAGILAVLFVFTLAPQARAQQTECPQYQGITCDEWVTDVVGVIGDDSRLESTVDRIVARFGHQIAVVVVSTTGSTSASDFAAGLGNTWGVGDAGEDDGIVILVAVDDRMTAIEKGPGVGLSTSALDSIRLAGNPFFADGDYEGGVLAILSALEFQLGGDVVSVATTATTSASSESTDSSGGVPATGLILLAVAGLTSGAVVWTSSRNKRISQTKRARADRVDGLLARLEVSGHELPQVEDFAVATAQGSSVSTGEALDVLAAVAVAELVEDVGSIAALAEAGLIAVFDVEALVGSVEVPLELAASGEGDVLDESVQASARTALEIAAENGPQLEVAAAELGRLVDALRPFRVASSRRRAGDNIATAAASTPIGAALLTERGERFLRAGTVFDVGADLVASSEAIDGAYRGATNKTARLSTVYGKLPDTTARPAVAAALADVEDDADRAVARYETVRTELERLGSRLVNDRLEIEAIAALLLMNNSDGNVPQFASAYATNRDLGFPPDEAVEYALAGLTHRKEIERIRDRSDDLGIPVSITAALIRRRDDGVEVFEELLSELPVEEESTPATRRTIAAILAISLEPAQAVRRWTEARQMLGRLGLEGAYADIAAAFGASDPRGPRQFALSYAATRQALANSDIDDADRFAPELAHEGTKYQTDTWTGQRLDPSLGTFDPFTMLYYRWVITGGRGGSRGWEPVFADSSWSGDSDSWFGGFGGGGGFSGGGSSGSWGGSSWGSGGGFSGGFGGGGGFSGGGSSGGW